LKAANIDLKFDMPFAQEIFSSTVISARLSNVVNSSSELPNFNKLHVRVMLSVDLGFCTLLFCSFEHEVAKKANQRT
jgi:hypothetical protein